MEKSLDKFGNFIVRSLFDKGLDRYYDLVQNKLKSQSTEALRKDMQQFNEQQITIINNLVTNILTSSIHDFLYSIEERTNFENDLEILIDGKNIIELSDGLNGELFSNEGWIKKYSIYKENIEP